MSTTAEHPIATDPCPSWCVDAADLEHLTGWEPDPGVATAPMERWHQGPVFGRVSCQALELEGAGLENMTHSVWIREDDSSMTDGADVYHIERPEGLALLEALAADLQRAADWARTVARA